MSDLARKSVEPIALQCGTAVRTLQQFLSSHVWDHDGLLKKMQQHIVNEHLPTPSDGTRRRDELGVIGILDETSQVKKGDKTPAFSGNTADRPARSRTASSAFICRSSTARSWPCSIRICSSPMSRGIRIARGSWLERRNGLTDTIHAAEVIQYHQQRNRQSRDSRMKSTENRL